MRNIIVVVNFFAVLLFGYSCNNVAQLDKEINYENMIVRMAALEIDSVYLEKYKAILKEEAAASVRLEPGVICIYPMFQIENPTEIRLLEIYSNKEAYELHLQSPHFKHYKETTSNMVKSLDLIEMKAIDVATMPEIFTKLSHVRI